MAEQPTGTQHANGRAGLGRATRTTDRELSKVAATHRGVHDRLAVLDPDRPHTYNAHRTLRLRVEFVRQVKRRRTQVSFGLLLVLPIIIACAFQFGGAAEAASDGAPELVGLATAGGYNFALFTEFASVGFLLVVVVALFAGDTVASEASWSSLRYLLAQPVPRARLLRQKLAVAGVMTVAANLVLPVWSFLVGGVFFGFGPAVSPLGGSFGGGGSSWRMLVAVGYIVVQLMGIAALAFFLSVCVDNPLGAVGGAVMLTVISNIIDQITALGSLRNYLLAHWDYSWVDVLSSPVRYDDMIRGTGVALVYIAVFLGLAFLRFDRKDITS
ncbi:ABC-2 type transport system permease protein [Jatrophihabitans endophyticus]|uniref:ABC-2 type transport system permease protein n=1 Tax=Jatrophihabitans endophyticus TaxID=1206085 RepID=A0A1M5TT82_9ACTN|nr:ABC transporter permease [Jatrophihabitans endophyticus]SHH53992.1 ABC-2 type transport system permease protein [Jatrophihabitans endophyticus]